MNKIRKHASSSRPVIGMTTHLTTKIVAVPYSDAASNTNWRSAGHM